MKNNFVSNIICSDLGDDRILRPELSVLTNCYKMIRSHHSVQTHKTRLEKNMYGQRLFTELDKFLAAAGALCVVIVN